MARLHLILAFHNHQPVGNFGHVLEDCYEKSYLPFLETLLAHPRLKVVLHYSGYLLGWMIESHPEAVEILRTLVAEKRAEILTGGIYEPILSVLPERDRVLQVKAFTKFIKKYIGYSPKGMWLAERVWEPHMPQFISRAGVEYLPIDDYHFKLTGFEEKDLYGYYVTEDGGRRVSVFPGSEKLRYLIPFRTVDDVMGYFGEVSQKGGMPLLTMADDGEKFGVWPKTYKLCYEEGWLDSFFSAVEKSDWIETTTFDEYTSGNHPLGRVYLPTASYREMGEWALPAGAALEYEGLFAKLRETSGERSGQLVRGGFWRSFMVKYPEANHIHKRMFMISGRVHEAARKDPAKGREALTELWKGQCNDAYWHGIFGGLYLPHLRSALYRHLLRAESLAANVVGEYPIVYQGDFDFDGFSDVVVNTKHLGLAATGRGGCLTEVSLYGLAVNVLDLLSRRPEAYHSKIADITASCPDTRTIHDQLSVKETGLSDYLFYDGDRRASFRDHFFPAGTALADLVTSKQEELGDFAKTSYAVDCIKKRGEVTLLLSAEGQVLQEWIKIEKTFEIGSRKEIKVSYLLEGRYSGLFAVELNMSLLGSPHPLVRAGDRALTMRSTGVHENMRGFGIEDKFLGLRINVGFSEGFDLWHHPVETVSLSEEGIERIYQGTAFFIVSDLKLRGRKKMWVTIKFEEDAR